VKVPRWLILAAVCCPLVTAAQTPAERLVTARRHIAARQLDSARAVLLVAIDSASGAPPAVRAEGFVLLAIVEEHLGSDSAARAAIVQAVRIDPDLQVDGLDDIVPGLAVFLEEERCRVAGRITAAGLCAPRAPARDTAQAPFQDCVRRCPDGVSKPILRELPDIGFSLPQGQMGPSGVRGQVTLEFIVSPEGFADAGSARIASSTIRAFELFLLNRLTTARFYPAFAPDGAVAARIRLRFDFRAVGLDRVSYSVKVL